MALILRLLSRQKVDEHIYFDVNVQDLPKTARTTATYPEIKAYVKDKYGLNVTSLNIAQVKEKHGFEKRENYNKGKDGHRVPNCPPEKEKAIVSPLGFCPRFPLRKPNGFPVCVESVKSQTESTDTCEQFANGLFHKSSFGYSYTTNPLKYSHTLKMLAPTDVGSMVYVFIF